MNKGMYVREGKKLYVYQFEDKFDLPFELLENALITKEINGHYLITEWKGRTTNKSSFWVVKDGNLYQQKELVGVFVAKPMFKDKEENVKLEFSVVDIPEPKFENFERKLLENQYYKTDKENFKKMELMKNYEKRFKKVTDKFS